MQDDSGQDHPRGYPEGCVNPFTEALILLQVFREGQHGYPRARLDADLDDLDPSWVSESIDSLQKAGVIVVEQARIWPSAQLRRLVALDAVSP